MTLRPCAPSAVQHQIERDVAWDSQMGSKKHSACQKYKNGPLGLPIRSSVGILNPPKIDRPIEICIWTNDEIFFSRFFGVRDGGTKGGFVVHFWLSVTYGVIGLCRPTPDARQQQSSSSLVETRLVQIRDIGSYSDGQHLVAKRV